MHSLFCDRNVFVLFGPQTGNFFINNEDVKIFYSYLEILENDQKIIIVFVVPDNFAKM